MSDDEEGRLLIDDPDLSGGPHNTLGGDIFAALNETKSSPLKMEGSTDKDALKKFPFQNAFPVNGSITVGDPVDSVQLAKEGGSVVNDPNNGREEGELDDDMDTVELPSVGSHVQSTNQNAQSMPSITVTPSQNSWSTPFGSLNQPEIKPKVEPLSVDTVTGAKQEKPLVTEPVPVSKPVLKKSPTPAKISPGRGKKNPFEDAPANGMSLPSPSRSKMGPSPTYNVTANLFGSKPHQNPHQMDSDEKKSVKEELKEDRKRLSSVYRPGDANPPKKQKTRERESMSRGTTTHTIAVQADAETPLFEQEPGSSGVMQYTIICKTDSNNVYISCRYKDQDLYGVLTDGLPPNFPSASKKSSRPNGSSTSSLAEPGGDRGSGSGASTPSKLNRTGNGTPRDAKRAARGSSVQGDVIKKKVLNAQRAGSSGDGNDKDDEELDVDGPVRSGHTMLKEVAHRRYQHVCAVEGCEHRYDTSTEMQYHKDTAHAKKKAVFDTCCTQTDLVWSRRTTTGSDVIAELQPIVPVTENVEVQTDNVVPPEVQPASSTSAPHLVLGESSKTHQQHNHQQQLTEKERQSIDLLMNKGFQKRRDTVDTIPATAGSDGKPQSPFSDISDDAAAPQLQKEEEEPSSRLIAGASSVTMMPTVPSMMMHPQTQQQQQQSLGQTTPARPTQLALGGRSSAFTPTDPGPGGSTVIRNDEQHATTSERKDSTVSLPIAAGIPAAQSAAFHAAMEGSAGKSRSASVSATQQPQQSTQQQQQQQQPGGLTASPRPNMPSNIPFMNLPPGMQPSFPFMGAFNGMPFGSPMVAPGTSSASNSTSRTRTPDSQHHKIHELKAKSSTSASSGLQPDGPSGSAGCSVVASPVPNKTTSLGSTQATPTAPSPASRQQQQQLQGFMSPMGGGPQPGGSVSASQQMQQIAQQQQHQQHQQAAQHAAQQHQQMMMLATQQMMMRGQIPFGMGGPADMQALQAQYAQQLAMFQQSQQPHMFQK